MGWEKSSLEQQEGARGLQLVVEQRPFVGGWFHIVFISMLVAFFLPIVAVPDWFGACIAYFVACFPMMWLALLLRRSAILTITPVSLRIDAWTGLPARPQTTTWPLDRLSLDHDAVFNFNGLTLHALTVEADDTDSVQGLACTTEELEQIIALVERRGDHARALTGDGEAEVPEALRKFLRPKQPTG
ncbi:MAG: hypothetical protein CL927_11855 [Deltaproteobacteria bacterium]|nr:hypothetical protein [Deltaproteobacteria bacterium]HCH62592.1 hypothetical protein [Deltaproteobacteria bacterium]